MGSSSEAIDLNLLFQAYSLGYFPMSDSRHDTSYFWTQPELRGVFTPDSFHVPRNVKKLMRNTPYRVTQDCDFAQVIASCGAARFGRDDTWISPPIEQAFMELHEAGFAHSYEVWQDELMIGGLYGLRIGNLFCGESMFSARSGGSKIALVETMQAQMTSGCVLFDCQFWTPHLAQFGCKEVSQAAYALMLAKAV